MSSSSALKYNITFGRSFFAAAVVFTACSLLPLWVMIFYPITLLTLFLFLLLLLVSFYIARVCYVQTGNIICSDSGRICLQRVTGESIEGQISRYSLVSSLLILLVVAQQRRLISASDEVTRYRYCLLYRDALSEENYRGLARLITTLRGN